MVIVSLTRDPGDLAAIRASGARTMLASSLDAGLLAASRQGVALIVCSTDGATQKRLVSELRESPPPCPLLLRHDLSRQSIDALYGVSRIEADIRSSYRAYDDLRARLASAALGNDANATCAILRGLDVPTQSVLRDFIAVMAVMGERPVMQKRVALAMARSASSFRAWLATVRETRPHVPSFPRINAHFVALHLIWRRERLEWTAMRAAAAAGFADDKASGSYLRYHLGRTGAQLLRAGGFDARMTATRQLFTAPGTRNEVVWRI
jgi:hypothetical protein